jgi:hypothetical protein
MVGIERDIVRESVEQLKQQSVVYGKLTHCPAYFAQHGSSWTPLHGFDEVATAVEQTPHDRFAVAWGAGDFPRGFSKAVKRKRRATFLRREEICGKSEGSRISPHDPFTMNRIGSYYRCSVTHFQTLSSSPFTPDIDAHEAQQ